MEQLTHLYLSGLDRLLLQLRGGLCCRLWFLCMVHLLTELFKSHSNNSVSGQDIYKTYRWTTARLLHGQGPTSLLIQLNEEPRKTENMTNVLSNNMQQLYSHSWEAQQSFNDKLSWNSHNEGSRQLLEWSRAPLKLFQSCRAAEVSLSVSLHPVKSFHWSSCFISNYEVNMRLTPAAQTETVLDRLDLITLQNCRDTDSQVLVIVLMQ